MKLRHYIIQHQGFIQDFKFGGSLKRKCMRQQENFEATPTYGHHTLYIACCCLLATYSCHMQLHVHVTWYAGLKLWTEHYRNHMYYNHPLHVVKDHVLGI